MKHSKKSVKEVRRLAETIGAGAIIEILANASETAKDATGKNKFANAEYMLRKAVSAMKDYDIIIALEVNEYD